MWSAHATTVTLLQWQRVGGSVASFAREAASGAVWGRQKTAIRVGMLLRYSAGLGEASSA